MFWLKHTTQTGTSQKLPPGLVMNPDAAEKEEEEKKVEEIRTHTSSSRLSIPVRIVRARI